MRKHIYIVYRKGDDLNLGVFGTYENAKIFKFGYMRFYNIKDESVIGIEDALIEEEE